MTPMLRSKTLVATATAAVLLAAPVALAGPWTLPSGSAQNFTYANGGDLNGRFGEPTVSGNALSFPGTSWSAQAADGASNEDFDILTFEIMVQAGLHLQMLSIITALGNYDVTGLGSIVDLQTTLTITELGGLGRVFSTDIVTNPVQFPIEDTTGGGLAGNWIGFVEIALPSVAPLAHEALRVEFSNRLTADAAAGGSTKLNQNFTELKLDFKFVPEPGTLGLLVIAGPMLLSRKRRRYAPPA